jgi:hypothetical protein
VPLSAAKYHGLPPALLYARRQYVTLIPGYTPCRRECLDWMLIVGRRHLERLMREWVDHYNVGDRIGALTCGLRSPSERQPCAVMLASEVYLGSA